MSNKNRTPIGVTLTRLPTIKVGKRLVGHGQQLAARRLQERFATPVPPGLLYHRQQRRFA